MGDFRTLIEKKVTAETRFRRRIPSDHLVRSTDKDGYNGMMLGIGSNFDWIGLSSTSARERGAFVMIIRWRFSSRAAVPFPTRDFRLARHSSFATYIFDTYTYFYGSLLFYGSLPFDPIRTQQ